MQLSLLYVYILYIIYYITSNNKTTLSFKIFLSNFSFLVKNYHFFQKTHQKHEFFIKKQTKIRQKTVKKCPILLKTTQKQQNN